MAADDNWRPKSLQTPFDPAQKLPEATRSCWNTALRHRSQHLCMVHLMPERLTRREKWCQIKLETNLLKTTEKLFCRGVQLPESCQTCYDKIAHWRDLQGDSPAQTRLKSLKLAWSENKRNIWRVAFIIFHKTSWNGIFGYVWSCCHPETCPCDNVEWWTGCRQARCLTYHTRGFCQSPSVTSKLCGTGIHSVWIVSWYPSARWSWKRSLFWFQDSTGLGHFLDSGDDDLTHWSHSTHSSLQFPPLKLRHLGIDWMGRQGDHAPASDRRRLTKRRMLLLRRGHHQGKLFQTRMKRAIATSLAIPNNRILSTMRGKNTLTDTNVCICESDTFCLQEEPEVLILSTQMNSDGSNALSVGLHILATRCNAYRNVMLPAALWSSMRWAMSSAKLSAVNLAISHSISILIWQRCLLWLPYP